jgi:hypothetical protein
MIEKKISILNFIQNFTGGVKKHPCFSVIFRTTEKRKIKTVRVPPPCLSLVVSVPSIGVAAKFSPTCVEHRERACG